MPNFSIRMTCSKMWTITPGENVEIQRVKGLGSGAGASAVLVATSKQGLVKGEAHYDIHDYRIDPSSDKGAAKQWILALGEGISYARLPNTQTVVLQSDDTKDVIHYKVGDPGNVKDGNLGGFLAAPIVKPPFASASPTRRINSKRLEEIKPFGLGGSQCE
jgi:hypothetical protein